MTNSLSLVFSSPYLRALKHEGVLRQSTDVWCDQFWYATVRVVHTCMRESCAMARCALDYSVLGGGRVVHTGDFVSQIID